MRYRIGLVVLGVGLCPLARAQAAPRTILVEILDAGASDGWRDHPEMRQLAERFGEPVVRDVFPVSDDFVVDARRFLVLQEDEAEALPRHVAVTFPRRISEEDWVALQDAFADSPEIRVLGPDEPLRIDAVPNDPYYHSARSWGQSYDDLWGLKRIASEAAWAITTGSPETVVAVVDTGLRFDHPDIAGNVFVNRAEAGGLAGVDDDGNGYVDDVSGYDFINGDAEPIDDNGHGSHVSGTIAAVGDNGIGVTGVMWRARILPLKACNASGTCPTSAVAEAVTYAADHGADVVNLSLGGGGSSTLAAAVRYAESRGTVVVAAAGNSASHAPFYYPSGYPEAVSSGSSAFDDTLSRFSNYGTKLDVVAPGGGYSRSDASTRSNILSLNGVDRSGSSRVVDGWYYRSAGTSMAVPHVAGVAGLLRSHDPSLSAREIRQILRMSATDLGEAGWDVWTGYGRVDAAAALAFPSACEAGLSGPRLHGVINFDEESVAVTGFAGGRDFATYRLELGIGLPVKGWRTLTSSQTAVDGTFFDLETRGLAGTYVLRLSAFDGAGRLCGRDHRVMHVAARSAKTTLSLADSSAFGHTLAAGDVDGDGAEDVLIGAPGCGEDPSCLAPSDLGEVVLVSGREIASGRLDLNDVPLLASWIADDASHRLGFSSALADVDGDGAKDVLLGAPGHDAVDGNAGRVCVFLARNGTRWHAGMSLDEADACQDGGRRGDRFGSQIRPAGDFNGDGYEDVVVVACGQDAGGTDHGRVHVYFGAADFAARFADTSSGAQRSWTGVASLSGLCNGDGYGRGLSATGVGDVNGDGFDDVAVASPAPDEGAGRLWILRGEPDGSGAASLFDADVTVFNDLPAGSLGTAVAFGAGLSAPGDVDADGFADVLVASRGLPGKRYPAAVHLIYGGEFAGDQDLSSLMRAELTAKEADADSHLDPLVLGDVNADGFADFAWTSERTAYAVLGDAKRLDAHFAPSAGRFVFRAPEGVENFAFASARGDFDGDGHADVALATLGEHPKVLIWSARQFFHGDPDADFDWDGVSAVDGDCDDFADAVRPGASEIPDRRDNDCDGRVDASAFAPTDRTPPPGTSPPDLGDETGPPENQPDIPDAPTEPEPSDPDSTKGQPYQPGEGGQLSDSRSGGCALQPSRRSDRFVIGALGGGLFLARLARFFKRSRPTNRTRTRPRS